MKISDILSGIAIIISILSAVFSWIITKKINKVNLHSIFFNHLFLVFLTEELPKAIEKAYSFKKEDIDTLEQLVILLYFKIKIYQYIDEEFYKKVEEKLLILDDYLVELPNHKIKKNETKKGELDFKVKALYRIFMDKYLSM